MNYETQEVLPSDLKAGDQFFSERLRCQVKVEDVEENHHGAIIVSVTPVYYRGLRIPFSNKEKIEIAREAEPPASAHTRATHEIWIERERYWAITSDGSIVGPCLSQLQAENELDDWEEADSK